MAVDYYTLQQTLNKLALTQDQLSHLVREGRLREFRVEGEQRYKVAEVDDLAAELNPSVGTTGDGASESAIELLPVDSTDGGSDVITLDESGEHTPTQDAPKNEDTVITPAGVNVFDEDELAGLDADPMAKTQIAPTLEEQLTGQGVGSGSGLLDLTRESDDTSLGAEVLGHIDVDGGLGSDDSMGAGNLAETSAPVAAAPAAAQVVMVEAADPNAAFFGGMIVGGIIAALILMLTTIPAMLGHVPGYLESLKNNGAILVVVLVVVAAASGAIGMFAAKSAARKTATT